MDSTITLKKTRLYHNWLRQVTGSYDIYKVITNNKAKIRRFKEGRNTAIMMAGGPKLVEGHLLPDNPKYRIKQISYLQGNYYIILKEENNGRSDLSSNQSTTTF